VGASLIASITVAVGLFAFGASLEGDDEKIFEGSSLLIAAMLLTIVINWVKRTGWGLQNNF